MLQGSEPSHRNREMIYPAPSGSRPHPHPQDEAAEVGEPAFQA